MPKAGKWEKGSSGNPAGRPKDVRTIAVLKNDLELAVREKLTKSRVSAVVNRLLDIAISSPDEKNAIAAGKTIMDYALSKAHVQEQQQSGQGFTIVIENATLQALQKPDKTEKPIETVTYDVTDV